MDKKLRNHSHGPSPLRLHLGQGLLRKGNLSYSSLRCRRVHLGAASLGSTQASLLTWVAVASVMAASLFVLRFLARASTQ